MKKIFMKMICALLAVTTIFSVSACSTGKKDDPSSGEINKKQLTKIEEIQAKYDKKGVNYSYDGGECTITFSHWDSYGKAMELSVINVLLEGFKKRYPEISVSVDIISEYEDNYLSKIAAGTMHDVFMVSDGKFQSWISSGSGKFVNLSGYIENSEILNMNDIFESAVTRYRYNGSQYALPRDISCHVMFYNKNIFDEAGVNYPSSEEIMTIAEAKTMWKSLTKNGIYGVAGLLETGLVWSAGGDFLNSSRNAYPTDTKSTNALKQAYQFIQDAYYTDCFQTKSDLAVNTLFQTGQIATLIAGNWNISTFREIDDFEWDIAYVPAYSDNPTANGWSGSCGYSMSQNCKNKEAAWKLIEYFASEEGQEILSSTGFQIPLYESLGDTYIEEQTKESAQNYNVVVQSAKNQPAGTWTYRESSQWKELTYDTYSGNLLDDVAANRWSVEQFLSEVKSNIARYL